VVAAQISYIGKEANRWEEQFFLGMDEDATIEYGSDPNTAALLDGLTAAIGKFGKRQVATRIGISRNSLTKIIDAKNQNLSPRLSQKIGSAIASLNSEASEEKKLLELARAEVGNVGLSEFARRLQINKSNLKNILDGRRKAGRRFVEGLVSYLNSAK
jgi:plasmid maintenance system antidote protein VapI